MPRPIACRHADSLYRTPPRAGSALNHAAALALFGLLIPLGRGGSGRVAQLDHKPMSRFVVEQDISEVLPTMWENRAILRSGFLASGATARSIKPPKDPTPAPTPSEHGKYAYGFSPLAPNHDSSPRSPRPTSSAPRARDTTTPTAFQWASDGRSCYQVPTGTFGLRGTRYFSRNLNCGRTNVQCDRLS